MTKLALFAAVAVTLAGTTASQAQDVYTRNNTYATTSRDRGTLTVVPHGASRTGDAPPSLTTVATRHTRPEINTGRVQVGPGVNPTTLPGSRVGSVVRDLPPAPVVNIPPVAAAKPAVAPTVPFRGTYAANYTTPVANPYLVSPSALPVYGPSATYYYPTYYQSAPTSVYVPVMTRPAPLQTNATMVESTVQSEVPVTRTETVTETTEERVVENREVPAVQQETTVVEQEQTLEK